MQLVEMEHVRDVVGYLTAGLAANKVISEMNAVEVWRKGVGKSIDDDKAYSTSGSFKT